MPRTMTVGRAEAMERALEVPSDLAPEGIREIAQELRPLLADIFALYLKTKNFHWHMTGPHYRDYHLMLDEQADQLFVMTDVVAERTRKLGAPTLHSVGEISAHQRIPDDDRVGVAPETMLAELRDDNLALTRYLRGAHEVCDKQGDVATASLIEVWIDETERRTWFLAETVGARSG